MRQARLIDLTLVGLYPIPMSEANELLVEWHHDLGPVNRPFHQEAFALERAGEPIAVATSGSIVGGPVAEFDRQQVVELTRLASANAWANRLMLRLWREVCAPLWPCWPVEAAVSYQLNSKTGNLYRFDGWKAEPGTRGSSGGGTWTRRRGSADTVQAPKTLWIWRYGREEPGTTS